jgi:hypothetical protein
MGNYQTRVIEIPGTGMDYAIRVLAGLAGWDRKFFSRTPTNDHEEYGSSGDMFVA